MYFSKLRDLESVRYIQEHPVPPPLAMHIIYFIIILYISKRTLYEVQYTCTILYTTKPIYTLQIITSA